VAGTISVVHLAAVRTCDPLPNGFRAGCFPGDAQFAKRMPLVRDGVAGGWLSSHGEAGTRAGCEYLVADCLRQVALLKARHVERIAEAPAGVA
jgi:hypothetical protein